jgi:hypothetical protein
MDCDEPHVTSNEKMQPMQWIEWPIGALVATGSLWSTNKVIVTECRWARVYY